MSRAATASKAARISGRIPAALLNAAKKRAHVSSDTELLELALSRLVLEDDSGQRFVRWRVAGMLAGLVFRLRKLPKGCGHERKLLNDGLLYLQARKTGCTVLTGNLEDFDIPEPACSKRPGALLSTSVRGCDTLPGRSNDRIIPIK